MVKKDREGEINLKIKVEEEQEVAGVVGRERKWPNWRKNREYFILQTPRPQAPLPTAPRKTLFPLLRYIYDTCQQRDWLAENKRISLGMAKKRKGRSDSRENTPPFLFCIRRGVYSCSFPVGVSTISNLIFLSIWGRLLRSCWRHKLAQMHEGFVLRGGELARVEKKRKP